MGERDDFEAVIDPLAGHTATCGNCGMKLHRGGTSKTAFHWQHGRGFVSCGSGQKASPLPGSIASDHGVLECRGCGWHGNNAANHPRSCSDAVEPLIQEPVHPDQEQLV